jgi:hypothetical protein
MKTKVLMAACVVLGIGLVVAVAAVLNQGDDGGSAGTAPSKAGPVQDGGLLPDGLVVASIKGEPVTPAVARKTMKAGDETLLLGTIGGRSKPFVQNRAMFIVTGEGTGACVRVCDACPPEAEAAKVAATVQVVGEDGKVVPATLDGHRGLRTGAKVLVRGTVVQNQDGAFLVNADKIAVLE